MALKDDLKEVIFFVVLRKMRNLSMISGLG